MTLPKLSVTVTVKGCDVPAVADCPSPLKTTSWADVVTETLLLAFRPVLVVSVTLRD